jgi:Domain of unknown function (DUF4124)
MRLEIMKTLLAFALLLALLPAGALAMNKCVGADGRVTYQEEYCPDLTKKYVPEGPPGADAATPEGVWRRQYGALQDGDAEEYLKYLGRPARDKFAGLDAKARDKLLAITRDLTPKEARFIEMRAAPGGKRATITAQGKGHNVMTGTKPEFVGTIEMVKDAGGWKVSSETWKPAGAMEYR